MSWPRRFFFLDLILAAAYVGAIYLERISPAAVFDPPQGGAACLVVWLLILMSPPIIIHRYYLIIGERSPFKFHAGTIGIYFVLAFLLALKTYTPVAQRLNLTDLVRSSVTVPAPYGQPYVEEDEITRELIASRYSVRMTDGTRIAICEPLYRAIKAGSRSFEITEAKSFDQRIVISDCEL